MEQQIQPAYATFEQGKKLKEKGFNQRTKMVWLDALGQHLREVHLSLELNYKEYNAPEQWQIVEWLRINHGIHVEVSCDVYGELWYANLFVCSKEVWEDEDKRHNILSAHNKFINEHKSPQEAYSAAFDYILNELI
jgi:hypothetical protein